MGSFFDANVSNQRLSTTTEAQQGVQGSLAEFFQGQIGQGFGLERLGELFGPGFLEPALAGFNQSGGTREQIDAGFASIGGTLSSRRSQTQANALRDVQIQAQGQFIQQAPSLLNSLFQPINAANQFAFGSGFENLTTQNPSGFQKLTAGVGAVGSFAGGLAQGIGQARGK